MASHVALLRAVNVGGTGRLAMPDLRAICETAGCRAVRTYIASDNVVFDCDASERDLKGAIEAGLQTHVGRPVGVLVRTSAEVAGVWANNPFTQAPGNRVMALFLDRPATEAMLAEVSGRSEDEELRLGLREIYVRYGAGMAASKLRIPIAGTGTARNMNTVAKLVALLRAP
nr:DUF1697 domain-containing protein [uncultured Lichenicoccus sp.]